MKFKVIYQFYDLTDKKKHVYKVGDTFPRKGLEVSDKRLKELSTKANVLKKPLIKEVVEKTTHKDAKKDEKNGKGKPSKTD